MKIPIFTLVHKLNEQRPLKTFIFELFNVFCFVYAKHKLVLTMTIPLLNVETKVLYVKRE